MARFDLTDAEFERLRPFLPDQHGKAGRPRHDDRTVLNGILWVLRTGAPWRDLPERYGPWTTVNSRSYRWRESGLWQRILEGCRLVRMPTARSTGRSPPHRRHGRPGASGRRRRKRGDHESEALGYSRGGFSTKIHLRAEGGGKPLTFTITPGQRHESTAIEALLDGGQVRRAGPGRPRRRPRRLVGDKGYSYPTVRRAISRRGICHTIPRRRDQGRDPDFDAATYRRRNVVERSIGWPAKFAASLLATRSVPRTISRC